MNNLNDIFLHFVDEVSCLSPPSRMFNAIVRIYYVIA